MAKSPSSQPQKTTNNNQPLIPKQTDPRAEFFWLLGRIEGQGVEGAKRLVELAIDLTSAPALTLQHPEEE